jgi:hypothetical protein
MRKRATLGGDDDGDSDDNGLERLGEGETTRTRQWKVTWRDGGDVA